MSWKMDGAFGELVAGMVNAEVAIAEIDQTGGSRASHRS